MFRRNLIVLMAGAGLICGSAAAISKSTTHGGQVLSARGERQPNDRRGREAEPNDPRKEPQPGDDRGKPHYRQLARENQPGDDRGGKGKPVRVARENQPGDDHGGKGKPITT